MALRILDLGLVQDFQWGTSQKARGERLFEVGMTSDLLRVVSDKSETELRKQRLVANAKVAYADFAANWLRFASDTVDLCRVAEPPTTGLVSLNARSTGRTAHCPARSCSRPRSPDRARLKCTISDAVGAGGGADEFLVGILHTRHKLFAGGFGSIAAASRPASWVPLFPGRRFNVVI